MQNNVTKNVQIYSFIAIQVNYKVKLAITTIDTECSVSIIVTYKDKINILGLT